MAKGAEVTLKSPAEFFAENQNIAGFDNPGKSLFTTIRELVENSLDACESLHVLPDIELTMTELSAESFSAMRGVNPGARVDTQLYATKKRKGRKGDSNEEDEEGDGGGKRGSEEKYFRIRCRDNGCGMMHKQVPEMFGRVLAGSKYCVKQARGKFGLGAKMALIWSKKSTGLPIEVTTAHTTDKARAPDFVTYCKLDIDIQKNQPKIYEHSKRPNPEGWHGSQVDLTIRGGLSPAYRSRIINYFQLLAVITPYAKLSLVFESEVTPARSFTREYERRSEQLCELAKEVKYHPKSVDNLIVRQLLSGLRRPASTSVETFLRTQFSCINKALAARLAKELSSLTKGGLTGESTCEEVSGKHVHQLTQLLRETTLFPNPDHKCLSPAGEYNLRLGVMKEFKPELVATAKSKPDAYSGHPFVVEAAVALCPAANKPGITVYRFANRIPLLFEGGNDVATVVANRKVRWASYMINPKTEKVEVFVSIVSTKIPFKGTGKEYIGADIEPIASAVTDTLRSCCQQLKAKVSQRRAANERESRLKSFNRYIPNVASALMLVVNQVRESNAPGKRQRLDEAGRAAGADFLHELRALEQGLLKGQPLSEEALASSLREAVEQVDQDQANEMVNKRGRGEATRVPVYLVPQRPDDLSMARPVMSHPLVALRLFSQAELQQT